LFFAQVSAPCNYAHDKRFVTDKKRPSPAFNRRVVRAFRLPSFGVREKYFLAARSLRVEQREAIKRTVLML